LHPQPLKAQFERETLGCGWGSRLRVTATRFAFHEIEQATFKRRRPRASCVHRNGACESGARTRFRAPSRPRRRKGRPTLQRWAQAWRVWPAPRI
jgi:hypothetical protein